jgi:hypothetical protein
MKVGDWYRSIYMTIIVRYYNLQEVQQGAINRIRSRGKGEGKSLVSNDINHGPQLNQVNVVVMMMVL